MNNIEEYVRNIERDKRKSGKERIKYKDEERKKEKCRKQIHNTKI